jgi:hypothetical protein
MERKSLTFVVGVLVLACAQSAAAQIGQPWGDRGYFNLNAGFETATGTLNDASTFRIYDENGSLSTAQGVDSGSLIDVAAGARVWRNFTVGIGFHRGASTSEAAVTGTVPHPLFFNRSRNFALSANDLDRTEQAVHLNLGYMLIVNDRLSAHLMLGPSFFTVKQEVVSAVEILPEGSFPFDVPNVGVQTAERKDSPTGFNVGVDISYKIYEVSRIKLGGGMFLRYSGASSDITLISNTVDSDLGGLQIGFGARVRF